MNKIIIRNMTLNDVDAIDDIRQKSWVDSYVNKEHGVTAELINDYFNYRKNKQHKSEKLKKIQDSIDNPNKFTVVATNDNQEVIGMIFGEKTTHNTASLGALYLEPRYIGKGNGRMIMDAFLQWLGNGVDCDLYVVGYNKRAINFYKKFGFIITSNEPVKETHLDDSHPLVNKMPVIKMLRKGI